MSTVAVMGGGVAGLLTAAYVKKQLPQLRVVIVAPEERNAPLVGESLTEFSTFFARELGLDRHLEEDQYAKYGLSFHFKRDIDDPSDRTYVVDEAAAGPPLPAFLINRSTFDAQLKKLALEIGVEWLPGKVQDVVHRDGDYEVTWVAADQKPRTLGAAWLVDASGRRRILARKWSLNADVAHQRSCFWFRLRGIDRAYLDREIALKRRQYHFDSYFSAQHFFGRGKWVWCIPIRTGREAEEGYSMSVGLTWRPDLWPGRVSNIDEFIQAVQTEHPLLATLVRDAEVVDTNLYSNYMYNSTQLYSPDGWFVVGDAGWTVDPLYSSGLSLVAVQAQQVATMISQGSQLNDHLVRVFETCFMQAHETIAYNVDQLYPRMHDPYQAYWTINQFVAVYFFFVLPMLLAGYHTHATGALLLTMLARAGRQPTDSLHQLLAPGSARCKEINQFTLSNQQHRIVNWKLWGPDERRVSNHLARFLRLNSQMRLELLHNAGWPKALHHLRLAAGDFARGTLIGTAFANRSLLDSRVVEKIVRSLGAKLIAEAASMRTPPKTRTDTTEPSNSVVHEAVAPPT